MKKVIIIIAVILGVAAVIKTVISNTSKENKTSKMELQASTKVNVWDTYVTKKDGEIMHFDIIAPIAIKDTVTIYDYGKDYLKTKDQEGQPLTAKQCRLCHMENLRPAWEDEIEDKGYFIIEMEGCD